MKTVKERTFDLLNKYVADDVAFDENTAISELNIDSFAFIQFIIEAEKEFGIDIPDEKMDMAEFVQIKDIYELLEQLIQG